MMYEFSKRCIKQIKNHFVLKPLISLFRDFLEDNVSKEIEKDRLIIQNAAKAFNRSDNINDLDIEEIFELTKEIDREFVEKVLSKPISIDVRYDDIGDIRKKRIKHISATVFELLSNWKDVMPFSDLVRITYKEKRFQEIITEILHLYNLETKVLSNSIKIPGNKLKRLLEVKIFKTMEEASLNIADEFTRRIFKNINPSCSDPI